tara:strand:- start:1076 stop:1864 length:789 start_codon:yes stop_codon:yes gene_type:complete
MSRRRIPISTIERVNRRRRNGETIKAACAHEGVSETAYYAHRARNEEARYPAIQNDWDALAKTFRPKGIGRLTLKARQFLATKTGRAIGESFSKPAYLTTNHRLSVSLKKVVKVIPPLIEAMGELSASARREIEDAVEGNSKLREFPDRDVERLGSALRILREHANDLAAMQGQVLSDRGRKSDPRVAAAAVRLARIHFEFTGEQPKYTINPDTEKPQSRFFDFTEGAFAHFLPEHPVFPHVLRTVVRHAAARTVWTLADLG